MHNQQDEEIIDAKKYILFNNIYYKINRDNKIYIFVNTENVIPDRNTQLFEEIDA